MKAQFKAILAMITLIITTTVSAQDKAEIRESFTEGINWPMEYLPSESKFYVHNEIDIEATPEVVWEILIRAETWPEWYEGAENVKVMNSENGMLNEGSIFTWKTMGLNFESQITEFQPPYRLSWESRKRSIQGYHAWLIIPTENGCKVITDESQNGWLTFFEKVFQPNKLKRLHDIWLMEIKNKAEKRISLQAK
jgi:uncharacterized protein YndB with AHSA1/START domain